MESLQAATALKRAGRFSDALQVLSESKTVLARTATEVLRADLLERVGEHAAATNTNLEEAVRAGRFREHLFYRLNVVPLSIRPLRERPDEIPGLVNHFVARDAEEFKKGPRVAEETMERLPLYRWPGNVRQLQNEIRRMVALAEPNTTLLRAPSPRTSSARCPTCGSSR
jgi:DNA-binding NtrC family response regulator